MKNKIILNSFLRFVLLTALIHVGIMVIRSIKDGTLAYLNYFEILDLTAFFPNIARGWISSLLSMLLMALILGLFIFLELRKRSLNK